MLKQLEGQDGSAIYVDPTEVKGIAPSLVEGATFVLLDATTWNGYVVKGTPAQVYDALFITMIPA